MLSLGGPTLKKKKDYIALALNQDQVRALAIMCAHKILFDQGILSSAFKPTLDQEIFVGNELDHHHQMHLHTHTHTQARPQTPNRNQGKKGRGNPQSTARRDILQMVTIPFASCFAALNLAYYLFECYREVRQTPDGPQSAALDYHCLIALLLLTSHKGTRQEITQVKVMFFS